MYFRGSKTKRLFFHSWKVATFLVEFAFLYHNWEPTYKSPGWILNNSSHRIFFKSTHFVCNSAWIRHLRQKKSSFLISSVNRLRPTYNNDDMICMVKTRKTETMANSIIFSSFWFLVNILKPTPLSYPKFVAGNFCFISNISLLGEKVLVHWSSIKII